MSIDAEYLQWCLSRLTAHEYCVYLAAQAIAQFGEVETTMQEIANICCLRPDSVRHHMKALRRMNFVAYDGTNGTGTVILWVRRSPDEKMPSDRVLKGRMSVVLQSPEGVSHVVKRGQIREFCRKYDLNRRSIYDVLEARRRHYKGWRVG